MIRYHRDLVQGSDEWLAARCGLLTASEMKLIVTTTLKPASNDKERAHLYELRRSAETRALRALDRAREALPLAIATRVAEWTTRPRAVALFGPIVTGRAAQQVDLLVVWREGRMESWVRELLMLRTAVLHATGLPLVLEEWRSADWDAAFTSGRHPSAGRVGREGLLISGEPLLRLTRGEAFL